MPRVLIVDDQPSFRRQLRRLLTRAGLTVVGDAEDIATAREMVRELQPDIAIVDVMLPGISGIEGVPQLKALATNLKVILVSAYHNFTDAALQAGAESFVPKDQLDVATVRSWKGGLE